MYNTPYSLPGGRRPDVLNGRRANDPLSLFVTLEPGVGLEVTGLMLLLARRPSKNNVLNRAQTRPKTLFLDGRPGVGLM